MRCARTSEIPGDLERGAALVPQVENAIDRAAELLRTHAPAARGLGANGLGLIDDVSRDAREIDALAPAPGLQARDRLFQHVRVECSQAPNEIRRDLCARSYAQE